MQPNHLAIATGATGWRGLTSAADDGRLEFGPAYWLERAGEATRVPGAAMALWALGKALARHAGDRPGDGGVARLPAQ